MTIRGFAMVGVVAVAALLAVPAFAQDAASTSEGEFLGDGTRGEG